MSAGSPTSPSATIVVIEDEQDLRDVVEYNLVRAGFDVAGAEDGHRGLDLVRGRSPDLVLLDVMLPGIDGIELCRILRADPSTAALPVIMLTARGDEADIVLGLEAGADDYLSKPFSPKELVARVRAVLRRGASADRPGKGERLERGGIIVDLGRYEVWVDGEVKRFTRTELRLLHALMAEAGRVLTREQLVTRVMGDNAWIIDRTIDVHIRAVRKKLGERAALVETVRGAGYRFHEGAA